MELKNNSNDAVQENNAYNV